MSFIIILWFGNWIKLFEYSLASRIESFNASVSSVFCAPQCHESWLWHTIQINFALFALFTSLTNTFTCLTNNNVQWNRKTQNSHTIQTEFSSFLNCLFYKSFVRMNELNLGENPWPWPKEMYTRCDVKC
jgi:hypothetical protein